MFWEPFEFRLEDLVVESLVISFGVIMRGEFGNRFSQGRLAEENHVVQARFFNGPDKAFRKAFKLGDRAGSLMDSTPVLFNMSRN